MLTKVLPRDPIIDNAKGIAIILMVIGHSGCPEYIRSFIYLFHVPFFFMASGYCFNERYINNPFSFLKKKVKGLYLPFVLFGLLFLVLHNVFFYCRIYTCPLSKDQIIWNSWHIIFKMGEIESLIAPLWFLRELFVSSLFFYIFIRLIKNSFVSIILCLFLAFFFSKFNIILYYNIRSLNFLATAFMLTGYSFKGRLQVLYQRSNYWTVVFFAILCICSRFFKYEMICYSYKDLFPLYVNSIVGSLFLLKLCSSIPDSTKYLRVFGVNTLYILALHLLCFKIVSCLIIVTSDLPIYRIEDFPVIDTGDSFYYWILYSIVGVLLPLVILTPPKLYLK